jgi:hypothetical protein
VKEALMRTLSLALLLVAGCVPRTTLLGKPQRFQIGAAPTAVSSADYNGDGKLDLLVSREFSRGQLVVMLGNGDGTFREAGTLIGGGSPRGGGATQDLDGDGHLDLILADLDPGFVSVMRGVGNGSFEGAVNYQVGRTPASMKVVDINDDGEFDIVLVNRRPDDLGGYQDIHGHYTVLLGNGDCTFQEQRTVEFGAEPRGLAVGDWNGDGKVDLAIADDYLSQVTLLLGKGDGTFTPGETYLVPFGASGLTVADLNGDKQPDLIVRHTGITLLIGQGGGRFQITGEYVTDNNDSLALADFDLDGNLDIATARRLLLGDGKGNFPRILQFDNQNQSGFVWAADFNGDKRTDLVVSDRARNRISVYLNQSSPPGEKGVEGHQVSLVRAAPIQ